MRQFIKNLFYATGVAVCLLASSGCVALFIGAAAGVGGYAWMSGVIEKNFLVSAPELQQATVKALDHLDLPVQEREEDRIAAFYRAEFSDGQNVTIHIKALTERAAQIRIRVGVFGNRTRSEMILNAVDERL